MKKIKILIYAFLVLPYIVSKEIYYIGRSVPGEDNPAINTRISFGKKANTLDKYLKYFGYRKNNFRAGTDDMEKAIEKFQYFAGVIITGRMDPATTAKMQQPRCARKDPDLSGSLFGKKRRRRYTKQGSSWNRRTLTWRYYENKEGSRQTLTTMEITEAITAGMALWQKETNINFVHTPTNDNPVIKLTFSRGPHGDEFKFDGEGGVLAHAFYPGKDGISGDVHFDKDDNFSIGSKQEGKKDLMWVVTHELGHSLGLEHSYVQNAIMYPWYVGYVENLDLQEDDKKGIRSIYGSKGDQEKSVPDPDIKTLAKYKICPSLQMTAIWFSTTYNRFFFITKEETGTRKQMIYSIMNRELRDGPILVDNYFPASIIANPIDSVLQLEDENWIFSGLKIYIYKDFTAMDRKVRNVKDLVPKKCYRNSRHPWDRLQLTKVDAAIKWQRDGQIYLFTRMLYWRYNKEKGMIDCIPRPIARLGLPRRAQVDAAYSSSKDNLTFFVMDNSIYKYDDEAKMVEDGYPKDIQKFLMQCETPIGEIKVTKPPTKPCEPRRKRCRGRRCLKPRKCRHRGRGKGKKGKKKKKQQKHGKSRKEKEKSNNHNTKR